MRSARQVGVMPAHHEDAPCCPRESSQILRFAKATIVQATDRSGCRSSRFIWYSSMVVLKLPSKHLRFRDDRPRQRAMEVTVTEMLPYF